VDLLEVLKGVERMGDTRMRWVGVNWQVSQSPERQYENVKVRRGCAVKGLGNSKSSGKDLVVGLQTQIERSWSRR
jgi:hypothetical protein